MTSMMMRMRVIEEVILIECRKTVSCTLILFLSYHFLAYFHVSFLHVFFSLWPGRAGQFVARFEIKFTISCFKQLYKIFAFASFSILMSLALSELLQ